jgi:serine/threonine protein kinase
MPAPRRRSPVFPDFIQQKRGNATIWVDRTLAGRSFVDRLADADDLLASPACRIVKDQKKIKVGQLTIDINGVSRGIYIKRYNAFSLRYRIASPFVKSGALRALYGAAILRAAKISTASPLAAVEHRMRTALTKSFFITEEIAGGKTADAFWRDDLMRLRGRDGIERRRHYLAGLAGVFRTLHGRQIYHNDLKDANILVVKDDASGSFKFFLLDLEGVKRYAPLSEKRRVKNLVQLHRTFGRYIRQADKLFFLKQYLSASFADRAARRRLIENVLRESKRLDILKEGRAQAKVAQIR